MMGNKYSREVDMYPDIIESISKKMSFYGYEYHVYKTWKTFDPYLVEKYSLVTSTLDKSSLPDITVLYKDSSGIERCLIIEVKLEQLIVKDIAQAKMYGDIFDADSVLLVSPYKIRKEFIEFANINKNFMKCSNGSQLYTCTLENGHLQIQSCFPSYGSIIHD